MDGRTVIISTENWKKSNRGFFVEFESEKLAEQLLRLVESDLRYSTKSGKTSDLSGKNGYYMNSEQMEFEGNVTLYILPDSNPVFDLISSLEVELLIEVPYMRLIWFGTDNSLELIKKACSKAKVKILLDSKHSAERNEKIAKFLNSLDCDIEVKLIALKGFDSLHGKIYSDGRCLITSANFNEYGLKLNREIALLMEGEACGFLKSSFMRTERIDLFCLM